MTLPLLSALAGHARLTVAAPAWGADLYGEMATVVPRGVVPDGAGTAILVKPAFRAMWEARRVPRRIGWPTDLRRPGLTDVVPLSAGHRVDQIGALAAPLGIAVPGLPSFPVLPRGRPGVVLLPLSASGPPVEWSGFRALADALRARGVPVCFAAGPGQSLTLSRVAGSHPMLPELSVRDIAAVFAAADVVVGNDSGLTHLAAAARRGAGRRVASVVGIAGSTDPSQTGAPGATWCAGPRPACAPCYAKRCSARLECLEITPDEVLMAVLSQLEEAVS